MIRRAVSLALLIPTLAACGLTRAAHATPLHIRATSRECTRSLDLTSTGYAQCGVSVSLEDFAAAYSFSDERIGVTWTTSARSLRAAVVNNSGAELTVHAVTLLPDQQRVAIAPVIIKPHSSTLLRLVGLEEIASSGPLHRLVPVELRTTAGRMACRYSFQLEP